MVKLNLRFEFHDYGFRPNGLPGAAKPHPADTQRAMAR